jgi:hypothetical protein
MLVPVSRNHASGIVQDVEAELLRASTIKVEKWKLDSAAKLGGLGEFRSGNKIGGAVNAHPKADKEFAGPRAQSRDRTGMNPVVAFHHCLQSTNEF